MESFIKADIFFFITTLVVVVLSIPILIAFIYFALLAKNLKQLSEKIKDEGDKLSADLARVRENMLGRSNGWGDIISFIRGTIGGFSKNVRRSPKNKKNKDEK